MKPLIRIHRPVLTAEEREQRMCLIEEAAIRLVLAAEENKRKTRGDYHSRKTDVHAEDH